VIPNFRFNEIKNFIKKGLEDFSISRLKEKMPWGIPVPDDAEHVMYVWLMRWLIIFPRSAGRIIRKNSASMAGSPIRGQR